MENKVTLDCMSKYGWKNVRGGIYFSPNDFLVYEKLIINSKQKELEFFIEKPSNVTESHLQRVLKGSNRSN
ncbi:hypothetical protein ACFP56_00020 [Paenibacillus septentrionalis]|uniref:Uncharacterized protein n=1 Tax=Paenibacillus septentrionalis TaxID=429342 RepID=A0ABW1UZU9_9BACL